MSTLSATNLKHASSGSNNIVLDSSANATVTGNLTVSGTGNQSIAGTLQFNSGYGSVATAYGCRAWINFEGTAATIGTGRANGNMDAVTDNGTGDYTVNFTNDMPDDDYAVAVSYGTTLGTIVTREYGVGSVSIRTYSSSDALVNRSVVSVIIFR